MFFTRLYSVSQKITPPRGLRFSDIVFTKRLRILNQFLHTYYTFLSSIYARPQVFIQLSPTLTKLCHIKSCESSSHNMLKNVHHRPKRMRSEFRRSRKSMALLTVVCGNWC